MAITLEDILIRLRGDDSKLPGDLDKASKQTKTAADQMAGMFKGILGAGIVVAIGKGISSIVAGFGDMVAASAQTVNIERTFNSLSASIGALPLDMMGELRVATRGLMSDTDLMLASNQLMAMGLASSQAEVNKQLEIGTQLGMAMGNSAADAAANWALMNANMSVQRLDSFGISSGTVAARITQLMEATKGMTREQAWNIAVMEQAQVSLARVGEQTGTAQQRWAAATANLKDSVGRGWVSTFDNVLSSASQLLTRFTPLLSTVSAGLGAIANGALDTLKSLFGSLASKMGIDFDALGNDSYTWGQNITMMLAKGIVSAISAVLQALNTLGQMIAGLLKPGSPPKLLPDLDRWGSDAAAVYMQGWGEADLGLFDKLSRSIAGYLQSLPEKVMPKTSVNPWIASLNAALAEAINQVRATGISSADAFDAVFDSARILPPAFRDYARSLMEVELAQGNVHMAMADLERATAELESAQAGLNRVTAEYDARLKPLNAEMKKLQDEQQSIQDKKRLAEIDKQLADRKTTALDRELLLNEKARIALRERIKDVEDEKEAAVDAEQEKVDAAEEAQKAAQAQLTNAQKALEMAQKQASVQERMLGIQSQANQMLAQQAQLLEQLAAAADGVGKKLKEGLDAATSGLGAGMAESVAGAMDDLIADVKAAFKPLEGDIETVTDTWSGIFTDSSTTTGQKINKIWDAAWGALKTKIGAAGAELAGTILANIWANITTGYTTWSAETDAAIWDWLDGLLIDFKLWLVALALSFATWCEKLAQALRLWLTGVYNDLSAKFTAIVVLTRQKWEELRAAIQEKIDAAKRWVIQQMEAVRTFLSEFSLYEVGFNILQSLWDGFIERWSALWAWVLEKADAIKNAFAGAKSAVGFSNQAGGGGNFQSGSLFDVGASFDRLGALLDNQTAGIAPAIAGGGGGSIADSVIRLILQLPGGGERDISFRLGEQRQMLIDLGQSASARGVFS